MAIEKKLQEVTPKSLTANGTSDGKVTVADTTGIKVKQQVILRSNTITDTVFEVKRVESNTVFYVGPVGTKITERADISIFTSADSANVRALEQNRPSIPEQEIERLTYEEEPTVARRSVLVDEFGGKFTATNPMPISTQPYDDVQLDYDPDTQDLTEARFYRGGVLQYTLTLEYDGNGNLQRVQRV